MLGKDPEIYVLRSSQGDSHAFSGFVILSTKLRGGYKSLLRYFFEQVTYLSEPQFLDLRNAAKTRISLS